MMHPLSPVGSRQLAIPVIGFVHAFERIEQIEGWRHDLRDQLIAGFAAALLLAVVLAPMILLLFRAATEAS